MAANDWSSAQVLLERTLGMDGHKDARVAYLCDSLGRVMLHQGHANRARHLASKALRHCC